VSETSSVAAATAGAAPVDPLLRRPPWLAVLVQGVPLALGLASHGLINLVDLALVGRLGEDAVRAAHVGSTWNFLPMILGQCVSTALLARLSRLLGLGERDAALRLNHRAQWWMVWLGIGLGIATALPAGPLVALTGVEGAVANDAVHYLVVSNLGCLPMFVLMQTTAAMRAAGEARAPLLLLLLANVVNLVLAALLLYGWDALGVPSIGVVGAAYAAVAGRTLAAGLAIAWLAQRDHALSLRAVPPGPRPRVAVPLALDALPQTVQIGLRAAVVIALTALVQSRYGDHATAAIGLTTRFDTLVLFSSLGFASAATAYAGRAVVAGRPRAARAAGVHAAVQAALLGAVFVVAIRLAAPVLLGLFLAEPSLELAAVATDWFGIGAWSQVLGAMALGAMGAVHGAGRMVAPLIVDLIGFPFVLAALWWWSDGGLPALFAALVGGMALVAALHVAFVLWGRWPHVEFPASVTANALDRPANVAPSRRAIGTEPREMT
jgi:putative MATE family efflux protein